MTDQPALGAPLGAFKFTRAGHAAVSDRPFLIGGWCAGYVAPRLDP